MFSQHPGWLLAFSSTLAVHWQSLVPKSFISDPTATRTFIDNTHYVHSQFPVRNQFTVSPHCLGSSLVVLRTQAVHRRSLAVRPFTRCSKSLSRSLLVHSNQSVHWRSLGLGALGFIIMAHFSSLFLWNLRPVEVVIHIIHYT